MLGLGETFAEVVELLHDVRQHQIDIFTAGQYLQPTRTHLPVERYLTPDEFDLFRDAASHAGIPGVFVGPLVRSSYHADEQLPQE
ncbi:MAG: lipoyl synthase, partial [Bdellovibrionales bacterium]|nr:lipoyl synthase [Bdellovibrionales bacterium]